VGDQVSPEDLKVRASKFRANSVTNVITESEKHLALPSFFVFGIYETAHGEIHDVGNMLVELSERVFVARVRDVSTEVMKGSRGHGVLSVGWEKMKAFEMHLNLRRQFDANCIHHVDDF